MDADRCYIDQVGSYLRRNGRILPYLPLSASYPPDPATFLFYLFYKI
jgi:hypothetical protein